MPKVKRVRLRVRCTYVSEDRAILEVLQMTFSYRQFGAPDKHYPAQHDGVFIHSDVMFIAGSSIRASYSHRSTGLSPKIYHVVHLGFKAGDIFVIPPKAWPAIKAAVIAYNEWVDSENGKLGNTDN